MCGIAGCLFDTTAGSQTQEMLNGVAFRGDVPNEIWANGQFAVGANRLAIVDREQGIQPMTDEKNRLRAVLNGEIYNHAELRRELERDGHRFRTSCDTAVLVHGYEQWGDELPRRLLGMFAFVVVDPEKGCFLAARDMFGIKPLYYRRDGRAIAFASEVKCLVRDNHELGGGIRELGPGHLLNERTSHHFAPIPRIDFSEEPPSDDFAEDGEAAERLLALIDQAVARRVQTDLKIGVLFGGGVDSGLIFALARRHHQNVVPLTVGLPGCEDILAADNFCRQHGIRPHISEVSEGDLIGLIPTVVKHAESFEPNVVRNAVFSYLVSRLAQQNGCRVCLCGEGADELFAGYPEFRAAAAKGAQHLSKLQHEFLTQLHRTQLQRVDRMAMAHAVEVRVPYLDTDVVSFAVSLPRSLVLKQEHEGWVDKWILRKAAALVISGDLPGRPKSPISQGAGAGGNAPNQGLFCRYADQNVTEARLERLRSQNPDYELNNKEEALYFELFKSYGYTQLKGADTRPTVNRE